MNTSSATRVRRIGVVLVAISLISTACGIWPTDPNSLSDAQIDALDADATGSDRGTLRMAHDLGWGGAESADPASTTPFNHVSMLVYDRLVRKDRVNRILPDLATEWERSDDGTVWTFVLREDVAFHDGRILTANDVVATFERIIAPDSPSPLASVLTVLASIEAVDDLTVAFHLKAPSADFPLLLTGRRMRVLPASGKTGIGTGPFQIETFDPENTTVLRAFDSYWGGVPRLDRIETIAIPGSSGRQAALAAGQLDLLEGLTPAQAADFDGRDDYVVQSVPTGDWRGIVFRTDVAPFDDPRVRRALRLVVDRREMIDQVANGTVGAAVACDTPVWSGDQYYAPVSCEQDIELARQLLAEAGYEDNLVISISTADLDGYWRPMLDIYQYQAAQAGVTVNVVTEPAAGYWSDVWRVAPAATTLWVERPAAQALAEPFRSDSSYNETAWDNAEFDELLARADATLDRAERIQIYSEAQDLIRSEGGALIPFHLKSSRILSADIEGIAFIDMFALPWHEVSLRSR